MKLSVVIVNYNVKHYLMQCLESVQRAMQGIEGEVFVVDNASSDGSVESVRQRYPWVKLLANKENMGFPHANNQAMLHAQGEYVLLLNPDTFVAEDTFARCIEFMDANPEAGATGVKMLNRNGTFAPESRRAMFTLWITFCRATKLSSLFPKSRLFGGYYMSYLDEEEVCRIEIMSGAFMFIRRETLMQVGLFDEDFFLYGEDIDLSYRLLKSRRFNYYLPTPIFHYKGRSSVKSVLRYRYYLYQSALIFFRKHRWLHYVLFFLPMTLVILLIRFRIHVANRLFYGKNWESAQEPAPCFLMLGSAAAIEQVQQICRRHGLNGPHRFVEATEQSCPQGHLSLPELLGEGTPYTHLLYDAGSYSYRAMLQLLQQTPGHRLRLATYSPQAGTLLTEDNAYRHDAE